MTRGFAYIDETGEINIKTVSPTERAAKVNAIVVLGYGIVPRESWGDEDINRAFERISRGKGRIGPVAITELSN